MKTGSQSDVFDYNDGSVNTTEAVPPTTRMYPPKTVVVPALPWQDEQHCRCRGTTHRPLCPERAKLFKDERRTPRPYDDEKTG